MKDDPDCPGCHTEMEEDRVDGDWRVFRCPQGCSFEVQRPLVSDMGGMTIESLQNIKAFNDGD